jgi:hypothetical protein
MGKKLSNCSSCCKDPEEKEIIKNPAAIPEKHGTNC